MNRTCSRVVIRGIIIKSYYFEYALYAAYKKARCIIYASSLCSAFLLILRNVKTLMIFVFLYQVSALLFFGQICKVPL